MHSLARRVSELDIGLLAEQVGLAHPSLVIQSLTRDDRWEHRPSRPLYPASMIKVPLVAAALLLLAAGELDESRAIPIAPANLTANDAPSPLVAGYHATLEELLSLAITHSDNIATNQLYDVLGRERSTRIVRERLGLRDTAFRRKLSGAHPLLRDPDQIGRNTFPAADAAGLFRAIARDEFEGAARLRGYLERQEWNTKLSAGLQSGDRFAHKTGDTDEVSHDGGILTTAAGRAYVVVVYTANGSAPETDGRFAAFMRELRPRLA